MSAPWDFTETQRRQFREAHAEAQRARIVATKNPTPQGISVLLRKAGFERAETIRSGRRHGENTAGYRVHRVHTGDVRVNHWPASVPSILRTTEFVAGQRRETLAMLARYAAVAVKLDRQETPR